MCALEACVFCRFRPVFSHVLFLKCFGFAITFVVLTLVMLFFALAVPLGVVFVSLVCPVPLCSCFLVQPRRDPITRPLRQTDRKSLRGTRKERESRRRRSNEDGEELACVTLFCLKDFPADSRGPRLLGQTRRGTGLNVAQGAQKGSHPSGSARGSGGGSNDHSARAAGGNVEGGAGSLGACLSGLSALHLDRGRSNDSNGNFG